MPIKQIAAPKHLQVAASGPQLTYRGGPLITNVKVVAIFWGSAWTNDPLMQTVFDFLNAVVQSSLLAQLAEYNINGFEIGPGSVIACVDETADPASTVDDTDIQAFVQSLFAENAAPQPDANTVYFVFTPSGVTVTLTGASSCTDFCGYHDQAGAGFLYAVVPYADCTGCVNIAGDLQDSMTTVISHELCEAITDPVPGTGWYDDSNGEIGDICESSGTKQLDNTQYVVQLEWSNAQNSCV